MNGTGIALCQINVTVGALEENALKIAETARKAVEAGAGLVVFPELALSGYPPEDLLLKRHFVDDCESRLCRLAEDVPAGAVVLVGSPTSGPDRPFNSAVVMTGGERVGLYHKMILPNYGVFDEKRVMSPGNQPTALRCGRTALGLHICEDSWFLKDAATMGLCGAGLQAVVNLSSSPYHRAKHAQRTATMAGLARDLGAYLLYCNLVGGQDELVFDGASFVLGPDGTLLARARQFEEEILYFELPAPDASDSSARSDKLTWIEVSTEPDAAPETPAESVVEPLLDEEAEVYAALTLGLRDYVNKNGFDKTVVAISGGIDSALVATLAVDALGPERVVGLTMPSQFTSDETLGDTERLAQNLGISLSKVAIRPLYEAYEDELTPHWEGRPADTTEENLQARIRGNVIMAFSNKFGWLVLTTGNKSEIATGYCTLYGDMAGGFAVIKDIPKTLVFDLCRWRNEQGDQPPIPPSIIERPPSAELRPDQRDTDSLPPYDVLDPILALYVEADASGEEIVAAGFDRELVQRVIRLVDLNEYKRRQGAPGLKITPKAFGRDRRLPITNRYRDRI